MKIFLLVNSPTFIFKFIRFWLFFVPRGTRK